ncbi:DMT family transporter [Salinisphaera sp.]|uniref:DMT family transporter n=1 Tax=Salinisphaera sp. TaxID=1914330 RepID=UPI003C7B69B9
MTTDSPRASWLAYLLLLFSTAAWGLNAVAGKFAVGHVSPMLLTNLRWAIAGLAALPFAWPHLVRDWPTIRRYPVRLAAYGVVGFACFNAAMYSALNYTSAINVVIIQAGVPGVIFALNFIVIRQRTTAAQLIGFVITVLGVGLIVSGGHISRLLGLSLNRGDALMLVAILCYGGFTAALRTKPAMHWLSFIAVIATAAAIGALPFTYWEYATGTLVAPDPRGLGVIIFAALVPGLTAQALFIRSNELIGANRAGVFFNLVPIFGTLFSVLMLGEALRLYHIVALALVLGGIALAERRR